MPRPLKRRFVRGRLRAECFKPLGIPITALDIIVLGRDEAEALRLSDYEGLTQQEAASHMNVSQPTFNRIYSSARKKIAQALVEGKALIIGGENMPFGDGTGPYGNGPRRRGYCWQLFLNSQQETKAEDTQKGVEGPWGYGNDMAFPAWGFWGRGRRGKGFGRRGWQW